MTTPTDQPASLEQRRSTKELWKIAAAVVAFAIVGAVLVLVLRDNGDKQPQVSGPGPTSTAVSRPTSMATEMVDPTREAAHAAMTATRLAATSTATVPAAPTPVDDITNAGRPSPGTVVASITVGDDPHYLAATDDAVWVTSGGIVSRIDTLTNSVVATVEIGSPGGWGPSASPSEIVVYNGQVWVLSNADKAVVRIDPATNAIAQTISVALKGTLDSSTSLAVDAEGIWLSDYPSDRLLRLDPDTGAILDTIAIENPIGIAADYGSIWVMTGVDYGPYTIVRIDETSKQIVAQIPVSTVEGISVTTGSGFVWVSDWGSANVIQIDPKTNSVVATLTNPLGTSHAVLPTDDGVWVSSMFAYGVTLLDPTTDAPNQIIANDSGGGVDIVEANGSIWASQGSYGLVVRIDPTP